MKLNTQVTLYAFDKWAIEFVGPIDPPGKKKCVWYIITARDYLCRWVEAQPVKNFSAYTTTKFIFENIFSRFGFLKIFMSDRGMHFLNTTIEELIVEF